MKLSISKSLQNHASFCTLQKLKKLLETEMILGNRLGPAKVSIYRVLKVEICHASRRAMLGI
jgi:hypothetical protein